MKNYLLVRYIDLVLNSYFQDSPNPKRGEYRWNFRCNVCGDSKKSKRKRRGNIVLYDGSLFYKCFNCDYSNSVEKWLKEFFPDIYRQYIYELTVLQNNPKQQVKPEEKKEEKKIVEIPEDVKYFKSINCKSKLAEKAIEYCKRRRIFEDVWKRWFIAEDGFYRNRLIIPFYDNNSKIYYWQGRTLTNQEPKYLNALNISDKPLYNIFNINKNQSVIAVEGPVDSIFINNSIALVGLNFSDKIKKQLNELNCYYLLDNDESGKEKSIELLKDGKYVFLWQKYLKTNSIINKIKDINNLYTILGKKEKFIFNDFKCCFTNNFYDIGRLI
jgi:DNA primase